MAGIRNAKQGVACTGGYRKMDHQVFKIKKTTNVPPDRFRKDNLKFKPDSDGLITCGNGFMRKNHIR